MKKLTLLLLLFPIFGIGQSKKELKEMVIQYQDTIIILSVTTDALRDEISELQTQCSDLKKENNTQKKDKTTLLRDKELLTEKINFFKQEESINQDKIKNLDFQIQTLGDSIQVLYTLIKKEIFVNDSLRNLKIHNIISLKDIVSNSTFSRKNIMGSWEFKTLVLNRDDEYIDFDDVYGYNRDNDNYTYDADESVIDNITFMDPNISTIELKDGTKMSCLFEIIKDDQSRSRKNINIKFVDTDREELEFSISEYGEVFIFNYNFNSLKNFFDRDDYDNNTNNFRISGVRYEDDWQVLNDYDIDVIGVIK